MNDDAPLKKRKRENLKYFYPTIKILIQTDIYQMQHVRNM